MHKVHVFVPHHAGKIVQHSPHGGRKALRGNMVAIYRPRRRTTLSGMLIKAAFVPAMMWFKAADGVLRTAQNLSSPEPRQFAE